jgi:hypothetical protein
MMSTLSLAITSTIRNVVYTTIGLRLPASVNGISTRMAKGEERAGELCAAALNVMEVVSLEYDDPNNKSTNLAIDIVVS